MAFKDFANYNLFFRRKGQTYNKEVYGDIMALEETESNWVLQYGGREDWDSGYHARYFQSKQDALDFMRGAE